MKLMKSIFDMETNANEFLGICDGLLEELHSRTQLCKNWRFAKEAQKPEVKPAEIVGGAPHGFGVWIEGKYHPVDVGSLATLLNKKDDEIRALKDWKESAMKVMLPLDKLAELVDARVGDDLVAKTILCIYTLKFDKELAEIKAKALVRKPLFEKFEDYFDNWDVTKDPEVRRLCNIVWQVSRLRQK